MTAVTFSKNIKNVSKLYDKKFLLVLLLSINGVLMLSCKHEWASVKLNIIFYLNKVLGEKICKGVPCEINNRCKKKKDLLKN